MENERLSALMDDELTPADRGEGLDELCADHALRRTWSRYHLIGEVLRDEAAALRRTPSAVPGPRVSPPARLPWTGLAIAAGVAVLAATVLLRSPAESPATLVAATHAPAAAQPAMLSVASVGPSAPAAGSGTGPTPLEPAVENARLRGYLVNFNEQRARRGVPGVHPYVRIVGYEAR